MDNKIGICLDNEYDTYIEELFFKKVKSDIKSKATRNNIIAAWRLDKKIYTDYSGSISHEFLHYSLHDQSHSISILQYVYLLLGEDLLNNFSVSDLWIMLEVSYSSEVEIPETLVKEEEQNMVNQMAGRIQQFGMNFNDYLKAMGKTVEQLMEDYKEDATKSVKLPLE